MRGFSIRVTEDGNELELDCEVAQPIGLGHFTVSSSPFPGYASAVSPSTALMEVLQMHKWLNNPTLHYRVYHPESGGFAEAQKIYGPSVRIGHTQLTYFRDRLQFKRIYIRSIVWHAVMMTQNYCTYDSKP